MKLPCAVGLGLSMALAAGCEKGEHPSGAAASATSSTSSSHPLVAPSHESLPSDTPGLGAPVYDLKMTLTDQNGRKASLDLYRGHPLIISMFYATCPFACPTLNSDIKRLDKSLSPDQRRNLRVLLVSFDPERDTPSALAALASLHKLDLERYTLAQAPPEQLRELAAVLGIKYRKLSNGSFNHSSVITLLDADGKTRARVDGLNQPVKSLADAIGKLAD